MVGFISDATDKRIITFRSKSLYMTYAEGMLRNRLSNVSLTNVLDRGLGLLMSPVITRFEGNEEKGELLSTFLYAPPTELALDRERNGHTTLIAYGTNPVVQRNLIARIMRVTHMPANEGESQEVSDIFNKVFESVDIQELQRIARREGRKFEDVFGERVYTNFLEVYNAIDDDEAELRAGNVYGKTYKHRKRQTSKK